LVSVVVCTYARPHLLRAALASVCAQQVDGVEAVVVNDGGPDVASVVAEFGDRLPVRLITLPTNQGLTAARRSGIGAARGQFVAFLDDDDLWFPDHLRVAVDGLGSGVDLMYTSCLVADRVHHLGSEDPVRSGTASTTRSTQAFST
jgi:glycosyltransferase involved in cell wall biosynthesis